jgi:hypothetical protein
MASLKYEIEHGTLAHVMAEDENEPIFVIRARDELGPAIVRLWAGHAKAMGVDSAKVESAHATARAMDAYECPKKLPD